MSIVKKPRKILRYVGVDYTSFTGDKRVGGEFTGGNLTNRRHWTNKQWLRFAAALRCIKTGVRDRLGIWGYQQEEDMACTTGKVVRVYRPLLHSTAT